MGKILCLTADKRETHKKVKGAGLVIKLVLLKTSKVGRHERSS